MTSQIKIKPTVVGESIFPFSILYFAGDWIYDFLFDADIFNRVLIRNFYATAAVIITYVLFVKWIGPQLMKNRKPFDLKNVMIIYNFLNAAFSLLLAWFLLVIMTKYWNSRCGVRGTSRFDKMIKRGQSVPWLWYLNKNFDLLDTVFFVMRKKNNQVTILHVIHHAGLIAIGWGVINYGAYSFYLILAVFTNSLIHVAMYTYYGLSAIGPHMRKYLWWKEYMTQMQIVQFLIILVYLLYGFVTGCEMIDTYELTTFIFVFLLLILFINFYRKSYKQRQS